MTSTSSPVEEAAPPPVRQGHVWSALMYLAGALVVGIVAAVIWRLVVRLPSYTVQADRSASVSERALTEFFSGDAWYVLLGAGFGLVLGIATWRRFKSLGWVVAFLAAGFGVVAGLVCWQLGQLFGGAAFDERIAAAEPGDVVPISLALRSSSALAVWAFAAVTPVLLGSALGPDEEAPQREPRRGRRADPPAAEEDRVDELGVVRTDETVGNP